MQEELDGIAIIGMTGQFPGARTLDQFWENLANGVESITHFSEEQLEQAGVDSNLLNHPNYVKAKGILEEIDLFDASFFGYNPREAQTMDPQQRLFLEQAWTALEQAGYSSDHYDGRIGVYAGVGWNGYLLSNLASNEGFLDAESGYQTLMGNEKDFLATRVSYQLNLKGPSISVQSACSTSLVATNLACQSLLSYQSDIVLAGGVTINLPQTAGYFYQEGGILSPDGRCRAFDAKAQGTVIGNGVGIVVLKRLADAIADGDTIHAVIRGCAMNNDGSGKVGYTAPSVEGQAEAIAEAMALADIDPQTIDYIETHGTGTALGDPIEIKALTKAFSQKTQTEKFCAIGSVKTNVGHLDAAAGVASLIKTVLSLERGLIPPSLHFQEPNPEIDFANSPFYVNTDLTEWKTNGTPRRAGVSSLGIGGTNAHLVLEEAPRLPESSASRPWQLLVLSAKTDSALETASRNLAAHLRDHPELKLPDVAYTLAVGRRHFEHRRTVVCQDLETACQTLEAPPSNPITATESRRAITFLFPGQGAQHLNMGWELYQQEPIFRETFDYCAQFLQLHLGCDLRSLVYPPDSDTETATDKLTQTEIAQPALFSVEYAIAQLWMSWGIVPEAMIGHSIGEYVAACLAGVFSLEDALTLVANRGRLMQTLPGGAMLAIFLPEDDVRNLLDDDIALAASNGPSNCVVSGSDAAIQAFQEKLDSKGIDYRRLQTSHAFHSPMVEPILDTFASAVEKVRLHSPQQPLISNVTGTWMTETQATDPNYWVRQLRETVKFREGIAQLLDDSNRLFLEVGPGQTLAKLTSQQTSTTENRIFTSLPHPKASSSEQAHLLETLGQLWQTGTTVHWSQFYAQERRHRLPLPTYPFERERYWIDSQQSDHGSTSSVSNLTKKADAQDWFYYSSWQRTPSLTSGELLTNSPWLVFVGSERIGEKLLQRFQSENQQVIVVQAGEKFSQPKQDRYTIDPYCREDYATLMARLQEQGQVPRQIIHLWSLCSQSKTTESEHFNQSQYFGFYSLLFLAQALGKLELLDDILIATVSNGVQDVTGEESLHPEMATILAACQSIPQASPNLICRHIDITIPQPETVRENQLLDQLLAELTSEDAHEPRVAYRGLHRWVPTFEAVRPPNSDTELPLRQEGVYLITGAFGDISLMLAEYLAQQAQAKLILIEHPEVPERDEWGQQKIQSIQETSSDVLWLRVDVADEGQMQTAIEKGRMQFGHIHGVIHGAETNQESSFRPFQQTEVADCQWHFQPKVQGTLVLERVLKQETLDFCILQSSLASLLGGFVAHSAANIFLDAFACKHNQTHPICWTSINWEGWQFWEERQMAGPGSTAQWALRPQEGVEAFQQILSMPNASRIVVSSTDLQPRIEQPHQPQAPLEDTKQAPGHSRKHLSQAYVAPRNDIERAIAHIWEELLGIEAVGIHDNFFELGGHSLLAVQVVSRLREEFQVELPLRNLLFETPTIAELAGAIARQQLPAEDADEMSQLLEEVENLSPEEIENQLAQDND